METMNLTSALLAIENQQSLAVRVEAADLLCNFAAQSSQADRFQFIPAARRLLSDTEIAMRCAGLALATYALPQDETIKILTKHTKDKEARMRVEAVGRLADMARVDLRAVLASALTDESMQVRFEAARGMAELQHAAALHVLLDALDFPDLRYRSAAALARLGNKDAVPRLKNIFHKWLLPAFDRTQIAGALAVLGEQEGVAYLLKRASKSWPIDRCLAIELLGEVRAPGAKTQLVEILCDVKDAARGAAARSLGRLGDVSIEPILLQVLNETSLPDDVRLDCIEGLLLLGSASGLALAQTVRFETPEAQEELNTMLREIEERG